MKLPQIQNILFLDDDYKRWVLFQKFFEGKQVNLVRAETSAECIDHLNKHEKYHWDAIFLDHDLGGDTFVDTNFHNTGSSVARWMKDHYDRKDIPVIIHSWNPQGAEYMSSVLNNAGFDNVSALPFNTSIFTYIINFLSEHIKDYE